MDVRVELNEKGIKIISNQRRKFYSSFMKGRWLFIQCHSTYFFFVYIMTNCSSKKDQIVSKLWSFCGAICYYFISFIYEFAYYKKPLREFVLCDVVQSHLSKCLVRHRKLKVHLQFTLKRMKVRALSNYAHYISF